MSDSSRTSSPDPSIVVARRLRIHGRVQGVYYRQSTVEEARRLGVAGWVRNRSDGSVEAVAVGPQSAVQALADWAHRGPRDARVDRVEVVEEAAPEPPPQGFAQRETL